MCSLNLEMRNVTTTPCCLQDVYSAMCCELTFTSRAEVTQPYLRQERESNRCCSRLGHAEHLTQYPLQITYFLKVVLIEKPLFLFRKKVSY